MIRRWTRIATLPVGWKVRGRLAAASGTSAATFGACCRWPAPQQRLEVRRAACTAVAGKRRKGAPEIILGWSGVGWRADPERVWFVSPVLAAVKSARLGRLVWNDW